MALRGDVLWGNPPPSPFRTMYDKKYPRTLTKEKETTHQQLDKSFADDDTILSSHALLTIIVRLLN